MYSTSSFQNTIAGVVLNTTHLYHQSMTFDKIVALVARASRKGQIVERNGESITRYEYKATTRITNPFRVLLVRIHNAPGRWLEVTDYPTGIHPGLMTVRYPNPHLIKSELLHVEPTTGALYTIENPPNWRGD